MNAEPIYRKGSFYLLISLIVYFVCSPLIASEHTNNFFLSVFMFAIITFCVDLVTHSLITAVVVGILSLISLTGYWVVFFAEPSRGFYLAHIAANTIFLSCMTIFVIRSVARQHEITTETLLGAICGYLMIGLTWSYIYLTIAIADPSAFPTHMIDGTLRNCVQHFIYFSFVTLTTLGYGDITAYTDFARAFTWIEAATGQIYLAVWISQLVGLRIAHQISRKMDR